MSPRKSHLFYDYSVKISQLSLKVSHHYHYHSIIITRNLHLQALKGMWEKEASVNLPKHHWLSGPQHWISCSWPHSCNICPARGMAIKPSGASLAEAGSEITKYLVRLDKHSSEASEASPCSIKLNYLFYVPLR